ncbi:rCG32554 [Rattus norvegicus]|uniref:RCG32554 n=1 Tax=Rattus norvegicus TaxID=10116 RepID=A6HJ15_RAT|nr:rCG32554 [Rattus norvegicus]
MDERKALPVPVELRNWGSPSRTHKMDSICSLHIFLGFLLLPTPGSFRKTAFWGGWGGGGTRLCRNIHLCCLVCFF